MMDDQLDPRFERAVRATLAELDPGNPPAALSTAVAGVPARSARPARARFSPFMALGGLAAALLVAFVGIGVLTRFSATVAPQPSAAPAPGVRVELVSDDPLASLADIVRILDARLGAADLGDSTIAIDGGRIVVDAPVESADATAVARLTRLLTTPGQVEGLATGQDEIVPGQDVPGDAYAVLFHSEDVVGAEVVDDGSGQVAVQLTLDQEAADRFAEYTSASVGETFAITVDGTAMVVPMINEPITDGEIQITMGSLDASGDDHLREMVAMLEGGPLPGPLRVVGDAPSTTPSPTAATSTPTPTSSAAAAPTMTPVDPSTLLYVCSQFPFPATLLDERRFDERADRPEAEALRAHLAKVGPDYDWLPDDGWALVEADDVAAEYVTKLDDGTVVYAVLSRENGWRVDAWGDCQPRMVLDGGIGPATWALAPGQDIGPETTAFDALVTEQACSGAQPADGRVVGPDIIAVGDTVLVTFGVRAREGPQTCPGNPSTRVTVTLPEPLGDRELLDGSTTPPRAPVPGP